MSRHVLPGGRLFGSLDIEKHDRAYGSLKSPARLAVQSSNIYRPERIHEWDASELCWTKNVRIILRIFV
jgi:hypothetical protein